MIQTNRSEQATGASLYERMGERTSQPFAIQLLDRLMPLKGSFMIDVAAGAGGLAVAAASRGANVLATDINRAMVERTRQRLQPSSSMLSRAYGLFNPAYRRRDVRHSYIELWGIGLSDVARRTCRDAACHPPWRTRCSWDVARKS